MRLPSPAYDPREPLIFMHVPKCGGRSVGNCLRAWFEPRYVRPRFETYRDLRKDPRIAGGRSCIQDHFSIYEHHLDIVYPGARQFFTVLREPFEMLLSLYFFGLAREGETLAKKCKDLNDFFDYLLTRRGTSSLFTWLPKRRAGESLSDYASRFMLIGTTDRLDQTMDLLADVLGKPRTTVPVENKTERNLPIPDRRAEFRAFLAEEYEFYEMARRAMDMGRPLGWAYSPSWRQHLGLRLGERRLSVPRRFASMPPGK